MLAGSTLTMTSRAATPLVIDLFCGSFGWSAGFIAQGWRSIGFDIAHESYHGPVPKHCHLVLQDVLTLDGSQFAGADCIVASPPCQEFSYMSQPWSRAKQIAAAIRGGPIEFPEGYTGSRTVAQLTALFDACFRIQREACEAAGRHIPMVVENVNGAQPWVGPARAHFGSFYFWGDVQMVGNQVVAGGLRFGETVKAARRGSKESDAVKVAGLNWSGHGEPGYKPQGFNVVAAQRYRTKQEGSGPAWFDSALCKKSSRSDSRKAASAQIARIPFLLSSYIARALHP